VGYRVEIGGEGVLEEGTGYVGFARGGWPEGVGGVVEGVAGGGKGVSKVDWVNGRGATYELTKAPSVAPPITSIS
jgi:hypothetical protein